MGAHGLVQTVIVPPKYRVLGNLLRFQSGCSYVGIRDWPRTQQHQGTARHTQWGSSVCCAWHPETWWLLSTLLSHATLPQYLSPCYHSHTNLAWQTQQFCQLSSTPKCTGKIQPAKWHKQSHQKKTKTKHKSTRSSSYWKTPKN